HDAASSSTRGGNRVSDEGGTSRVYFGSGSSQWDSLDTTRREPIFHLELAEVNRLVTAHGAKIWRRSITNARKAAENGGTRRIMTNPRENSRRHVNSCARQCTGFSKPFRAQSTESGLSGTRLLG